MIGSFAWAQSTAMPSCIAADMLVSREDDVRIGIYDEQDQSSSRDRHQKTTGKYSLGSVNICRIRVI